MTERQERPGGVRHVRWYQSPIDRETLARLNVRSDARGLVQAMGYLGVLVLTAGAAIVALGLWPWWVVAGIVFVHGTVAGFCTNGVHELTHRTVFRTPWLNDLFVRVFAFVGWFNFRHYASSHVRHHQFTLHPPDDLEVVLPIRLMIRDFFLTGFVNGRVYRLVLKPIVRHAMGRFEGAWDLALFPPDRPYQRRPVIRWARVLLFGHGAILVVSLLAGWWIVPVLTSLTPIYGGWLFFLCNNTQHIGLQDNVPDFRLCTRTFIPNRLVRFLYWHMNYHIEHHMYAAVPCYNLSLLRRAIERDLPPAPRGIIATWREIAAIQRRQDEDPSYQYAAPLPG
jgi:fatty acid desaturase